ncbi:MAG: peroxiredoxin [Planctomycetia bacterium]|nr:peroxiredoxin [Planctomycetia bacterium]
MPSLVVGDAAPAFSAVLQDGSRFDSTSVVGKKTVVLFFYPKDNTPVCTKEACAFRDSYEAFTAAGAEVIGVSSDSPASHLAFAAKHRLPFPIISDHDRALRRLFGVPNPLGVIPGRVTYVIDRQGIVRLVFSALFASADHVRKALAAVQQADRPA